MAKKIKCGNPGMLQKMGSSKIVKESIFLTPVTDNEIIEVIGSLKNDTSAGPDAIQVKLIKAIHIHITKPICHIINLAFSSGSLPQQWKESIVVPVFKGGTQDDPSNYRPISLLNNLAKIFEKCLQRRFLFFFEQQGILSDRQFGFRRGVSTEDAVLSLVKDLVTGLDESRKCMTVFLDLAKAFDTVSHEILLAKLRNVGIRGVAHKLMEDYLKDRTQYVKIDDCVSNSSTILLGVPQGTVLGPLLFLIYMNDILELKNIPGKIISYADDTAVVFIGESWDTLYRTAEKCLADICGWLNINLLTLNFNKSKFITFSITCENQPDENLLFIHNEVCNLQGCTCPSILRVDEVKYLGVVIDKYLRWEAQAALLTKKLRQLMHAFYGLRDILSRQNIRMVYYSLVESILRYCIVVWGGLTINARRNLQTSQNTLIKIMLRKDRLYPTRDLYGESKLMNLENLFIYQSLMYMFSNNHPLVNYGNKYMTRLVSNESLQIPLFKKSHSQNSIFYLGPKFYNRLPLYVRKMKTKRRFKSEVKVLILEGRLAFDSLIS